MSLDTEARAPQKRAPVVVDEPVIEAVETPVYDPAQPSALVAGGDYDSDQTNAVRYIQNGQWFTASGRWLPDPSRPVRKAQAPVAAAKVEPQAPLDEEEIERLLETPRGIELMSESRDVIVRLVLAAGGATVAGDGSTRYMVAWLARNTQ